MTNAAVNFGTLQMIPLAQIYSEGRLRRVNSAYVEGLAASIREHGLQTPIQVSPLPAKEAKRTGRRYVLAAGKHRIEAVTLLGWSEVPGVVGDRSALQIRLAEIDENLIRRELTVWERGVFLAERQAVYEAMHPETKKGGKGLQAIDISQTANLAVWVPAFSEDAAERMGMGRRSIERAVSIVRRMAPETRIVESQFDKVEDMLDAFFDPEHRDHRHARSFKECYVVMTGDTRVTGSLRHADQARMREALGSTSFDQVLGDSITRRMVADYRTPDRYAVWRQLADVVSINDFRSQERPRFGGYGELPAVAESGSYDPLTSPTDESSTYSVSKRGGTEKVTLEMIKNDDVGVIRRIPVSLSRSAKRTLSKFVLDFLATNPTIYDTVALFHASHGNLGTSALDKTTFAAGRLAMLKQTELGSADRLGVGPANLWVSQDGEEGAVDLFRRNTENDKTFVQSLSPNVIPVWYWTDADDWFLSADKMDIPTVEIGFLDGNEEPELFVQDMPNTGSMFSNDQLTWKIRHIYGGNVLDYRGLYAGIVP